MFLSMTGFGRAMREFPWGTVTFELTSVNHRYQDFSARLPRELSSLESRLISMLRASLNRGKVRLSAEIAWNPGARTPTLDEEGLLLLFRRVRELAAQERTEAPSLASFLTLPGICEAGRTLEQVQDESQVWDELLASAVESLMEMKRAEGEKLKAVIEAELNAFTDIVAKLEDRWKTASAEAIEALRVRIEKVMEHYKLEIDEARIAQEVSLMADKWDVSEELARLAAHIERFHQTMGGGETSGKDLAGRRLDFLIQEMNREVNTMGSKVGDADFRWGVVEAKSCLERIREQIQNVE